MRFPRVMLPLVSAVLALSFFGCSDVNSTDLKTSGIKADLGVIAYGNGDTQASAEFMPDGSATAFVELQQGDQVTATTGDKTQTLQESKLVGIISYAATFSGADAEGTTYTFALHRQSDTSATANSATLPAAFNLTSPTGSSLSYSRANDDIVVSYDNSGKSDPMTYQLDGDCIDLVVHTLPSDSGSFTIPKASIPFKSGGGATSCQVTLSVSRTRTGTLDPAFAGGGTWASQERKLVFTSTP